MDTRKRTTSHKVGSDTGELTIVLTEPAFTTGAVLSNWQMVHRDPNGLYIIFSQLNAMGANEEAGTIEAPVQAHVFIPNSHIGSFMTALETQLKQTFDEDDGATSGKYDASEPRAS